MSREELRIALSDVLDNASLLSRPPDLLLENDKRTTARKLWHAVVAVTAFFDLVAALTERQADAPQETAISDESAIRQWIHRHVDYISFVFSLAWLIDALVAARRTRKRSIDRTWTGRWCFYIVLVAVQLLFLPLGFGRRLFGIVHPTHLVETAPSAVDSHATTINMHTTLAAVMLQHLYESSSETWQQYQALLYATVHALALHLLWRWIRQALRHPLRFRRHLQHVQRVIRSVRYLLPLVGALQKVYMRVGQYRVRKLQFHAAHVAQLCRQRWRRKLSEEELREHSATIIQAAYRSYRARKVFQVLCVLRETREEKATTKLQRFVRRKRREARRRTINKCKLMKKLQAEKEACGSGQYARPVDHRLLYQLEQELRKEASYLINQKLLLRPNSTFAVVWGGLLIASAIFEFAQISIDLTTSERIASGSEKMELLIAAWLLPVPFGEREVCCTSERHAFKGSRLLQPIAGIVQRLHKQQPTVRETPWYCRVPYTTVQQLYINLVKLIINRFFAFFGFVCFLDVFVTFFTGQYDKCSGLLKSKPFFQRWIMPGLALQLLVNPEMASFTALLGDFARDMANRDIFRFLRWTAALFVPLALWAITRLRNLWQRLVRRQNRTCGAQVGSCTRY